MSSANADESQGNASRKLKSVRTQQTPVVKPWESHVLTSTPASVSVSTKRVSSGSVCSVSSDPDVHNGLSTDSSLEGALYEATKLIDKNDKEKVSELKREDSNSSVLLILNSAIEALEEAQV